MCSGRFVYNNFPWEIVVPSMKRAVGTRVCMGDGGPTVGTVGRDETSRCDEGPDFGAPSRH